MIPSAWFLKVTASPRKVVAGQQVTFTASRYDGVAVNAVESWHWVPADSTKDRVALPQCGTSKTCTITATESGWGVANAAINGALETAHDYVVVLGCPTGDRILDNVTVRDTLASMWYLSRAPENSADSRERVAHIFDSSGVIGVQIQPPVTGDNPCRASVVLGPPPPGWRRIAVAHTHPVETGDTLPANCNLPSNLPRARAGWGDFGPLSGPDWALTIFPPGQGRRNVYAYDRLRVHRGDSLMTNDDFLQDKEGNLKPKPNRWRSHLTTWQRHQPSGGGACSIIDLS